MSGAEGLKFQRVELSTTTERCPPADYHAAAAATAAAVTTASTATTATSYTSAAGPYKRGSFSKVHFLSRQPL